MEGCNISIITVPEFKTVTTVTDVSSLDRAVWDFVNSSHCKDDKVGLYNQTLEGISSILINKPTNMFLWTAEDNGKVIAYALTHTCKDVDNKMCYWMTQAWVDKQYRNTGAAKAYFQQLRSHAKSLLCKHIIVVSSRNTEAYLRFLGKNWHVYTTLLKENI